MFIAGNRGGAGAHLPDDRLQVAARRRRSEGTAGGDRPPIRAASVFPVELEPLRMDQQSHDERFAHARFTIRRKVLTITGASFHVIDPGGNTVFFSRLKAFKLKEDIRLFTDERMQEELLRIRARKVIDFAATYDVYDSVEDVLLGSLRRRGVKSMIRDEWVIFDELSREIARVHEDSTMMALLRRGHELMSAVFPQTYNVITPEGKTIATFKQNYNPFVHKIDADFSPDERMALDPRLGLAGAILICGIEGRQ
jgi:hypothetical protein